MKARRSSFRAISTPSRAIWASLDVLVKQRKSSNHTSGATSSGAPKPLVLPSGVASDRLSEAGETDLSKWFLLAALVLLLAGGVVVLKVVG